MYSRKVPDELAHAETLYSNSSSPAISPLKAHKDSQANSCLPFLPPLIHSSNSYLPKLLCNAG